MAVWSAQPSRSRISLGERVHGPLRQLAARGASSVGPDRDDAGHALRVPGGQLQRMAAAARVAERHDPLDAERVEHRRRRRGRSRGRGSARPRADGRSGRCRAGRRRRRGAGARGTATWDFQCREWTIAQLGRRRSGGLVRAVRAPVRRARRRARRARQVGRAVPGCRDPSSAPAAIVAHGRASSTRLNGVSVARRKRVKPPAVDDVAQPRLAGLRAERRGRPPATATPACRSSSRRRRRRGRPG